MLTVNHAIIHKLVKEVHSIASVVERQTALPLTDPVKKLVYDIQDLYSGRAGKGYGRFEDDETNYPSATILRSWFKDKKLSFDDASKKLLRVLQSRASQVPLATGGYVLMAQFSDLKTSWFVAAIINNVDASAIKDDSLEVIDAVHVDLENLRVAGRVNLNEWLYGQSDTRYVGFLKQQGIVSDYFKRFLGCNDVVKSTEETRKLVDALIGFSKKQELDHEGEEEFLKLAHDTCHRYHKDGEPINLEALSNAIWPTSPKKLQRALASADVQICDGFMLDARVLRSFLKIKAKTKYWRLDLDRQALASGEVKYNPNKHELVLKHLPPDLIVELDREISNEK